MNVADLRSICSSFAERYQNVIFDILQPPQQPSGYHPQPDSPVPQDWFVCNRCRQMPKLIERVYYGKRHCVSLLPVSWWLV